jgi:phage tail-like protein
MPALRANAVRFDPYKNFKFRVRWDGRFVAGVSKISALKRTTEVIEARDGNDPGMTRKLPGRTTYEPITLERGVSHDAEFEQWANAVAGGGSGAGAAATNIRKDIVIELYDEAGRLALAYKVYRCWVSEYQALPDLDANANAVAIQHIKFENEGWERDYEVVEPTEGTLLDAAG